MSDAKEERKKNKEEEEEEMFVSASDVSSHPSTQPSRDYDSDDDDIDRDNQHWVNSDDSDDDRDDRNTRAFGQSATRCHHGDSDWVDFDALKDQIIHHFQQARSKLLGELDLEDGANRERVMQDFDRKVAIALEEEPPVRMGREREIKEKLIDETDKKIQELTCHLEWSESVNAILTQRFSTCQSALEPTSTMPIADSKVGVPSATVIAGSITVDPYEIESFIEWILGYDQFNYTVAEPSFRNYLIPLCIKLHRGFLGELVMRYSRVGNLVDLIFDMAGDDLLSLFPDLSREEVVELYSPLLPPVRLMRNYLQVEGGFTPLSPPDTGLSVTRPVASVGQPAVTVGQVVEKLSAQCLKHLTRDVADDLADVYSDGCWF